MDVPVRTVVLGLAWLVGWWLLWRIRTVPAPEAGDPVPGVSVVIPARDEEAALPTLLAGLAAQTSPAAEVLVVDDHSADGTAAVAVAGGARVVASEPLPAGWTGKAWALWQGAHAAREDVVVFLDADVEPSEHLLARLVATFGRDGGLVSVQPYHRVRRWWERASAYFNVVAVMGVGIASPRRPRRERAAFGPCVVCSKDAFLERGDAARVRGAVLEDVELARCFVDAGDAVRAYCGRGLVEFRMYDRPTRLVEGWSKNFAAGAASTPILRVVLIVVWVAASLVAGWGLLAGGWAPLALYAVFAVQFALMLRQVGSFGMAAALVYPVLGAVFVAIFGWALVLTARGEVRWKGRAIPLRTRGP